MAAEHLRALIEQVAPGRSVLQLTRDAAAPENRLAYWLKPGTALTRMPTMIQIQEIARILRCPSREVYRAFRMDIDGDLELDEDLTEDERALLAAYRRLPAAERQRLIKIADVLHQE